MKKFFLILIVLIVSTNLFPSELEIVVGDKVNVRNKPHLNGKVIMQLKIAELVKVLKRTGVKVKISNIEGEWVMIDTGYRSPNNKGWVFDYFLADINKFKQIKNFKNCLISGHYGDSSVSFYLKEDGSFTGVYDNNFPSKSRERVSGHIFKYRNVIALKDKKTNRIIEYFFLKKPNEICYSHRKSDGSPAFCNSCK